MMDVTRRWWTLVGLGLVLIVTGVLGERPVLIVGGAGVGAWLLATAASAVRDFTHVDSTIAVSYESSIHDAFVDGRATATLGIDRPESASNTELKAQGKLPPGVTTHFGDQSATLSEDITRAETTFDIEFPIAGRFQFPVPEIEFRDTFGLYEETVRHGEPPVVTVRPRTPTLHVGRGGNAVRGAYGEHPTDQAGPGVTTRELRQYVAGDALRQIDWKATARLGEPYVRETEGETDRQLVVVFDHRQRMETGHDGETMLDYAREFGIGVAEAAADVGDPMGLWTVGDEGITTRIRPSTSPETYDRIQSTLFGLDTTAAATSPLARSAGDAQRIAAKLDGDDQFASVLQAYVSDTQSYVERLRDDPLVETVRELRSRFATDTLLVLVTTDTDPVRLREAAKLVTQSGSQGMLFIAPECLFETATMTQLDETYDRYRAFEQLRRELDGHPRLSVFEIAPGDRLHAVLAKHRTTQPQ